MSGLEWLFVVAIVVGVMWRLEVTHRRTNGLPRMPFGADADSEASAAYRRQVAELRQLRQLSSDTEPARRPVASWAPARQRDDAASRVRP